MSFKIFSLCVLLGLVIAEGDLPVGPPLVDTYAGKGAGIGLLSSTGLLGSGLSTLGSLHLGPGPGFGGGALLAAPVLTGVANTPAAVHSRRTVEVLPLSFPEEPVVPQIIEVEPIVQPVQVIFRTISSPVLVKQIHTPGAPGQMESTHSEDEPHRVVHEVSRPIIQEVREVIQPYRRVVQEVRPVLEEVHTLVAKSDGRRGKGLVNNGLGNGLGNGLAHGYSDGAHYKKAKAGRARARA